MLDPKWSFYSHYNTDQIANMEFVLDTNNCVIKRLKCNKEFKINRNYQTGSRFISCPGYFCKYLNMILSSYDRVQNTYEWFTDNGNKR